MALEDMPTGKKEGADMKVCPICEGKGKDSNGHTCGRCKGTGKVPRN
jgi:hypothetical protein